MKVRARDRRKWFAANFGRGYFQSQPLINPWALLGFAIPCIALLVCAVAVMAASFGTPGYILASTIPLVAGQLSAENLKKNKTEFARQAQEMLEAANQAGGFTEETRKAYNELIEKMKKNNELLQALENNPIDAGVQSNQQIALRSSATQSDDLINAGRDSERARVKIINETVASLKISQSFATLHIDKGTAIEVFRKLAIDEAAAEEQRRMQREGISGVSTPATDPRLRDEADTRRYGMVGALLERFEPKSWGWDDREKVFHYDKDHKQRLNDVSRSYVGMTLLDIAKECLTQIGIRWQSKNRAEIVQLAFQSTSDFPYILADAANKTLRAGYEMADQQWRLIAARRTAPDFKQVKELTIDGSASLELVGQSGEFRHGKLVEGKEVWQLSTYGKIIGITRQAIINDDLGAFTRTPFILGQKVGSLETTTVVGIITTNGNLSDSTALFEATTHKNYISSGAAIAVDSIGALRVKMMLQTGPGGEILGIPPSFLVAPATKAQLAEQYCSPNYQAAESSKINPYAGKLTPVILPILDGTSTTAWYLFANPNTPNGTVLIYGYLEGQEGPYTETRQGFDVDGVEIKIRHDFAAGAVDYRGAAKQAGA